MTATSTSSCSFSSQSWEFERPVPGGIVVGIDGSKPSIAALNTGAAIARQRRCRLHVVTVIAPASSSRLNGGLDDSRQAAELLRVALKDAELATILDMVEPLPDWTHEVIAGRPSDALAHIAESRGADLLIIGQRTHGFIGRALGDETSVQVMRCSAVPVLVTARLLGMPSAIVVATDFSPSSSRAACAAANLLGASGTLYLVHVDTTPDVLTQADETRAADHIASSFRRLIASLRLPPRVTVEPIVLTGKTVSVIEEFARRVNADMIAVGSHGRGPVERLMLGSVATGMIRESHCAVLVTPPTAGSGIANI